MTTVKALKWAEQTCKAPMLLGRVAAAMATTAAQVSGAVLENGTIASSLRKLGRQQWRCSTLSDEGRMIWTDCTMPLKIS
jgi:hypothetical protein